MLSPDRHDQEADTQPTLDGLLQRCDCKLQCETSFWHSRWCSLYCPLCTHVLVPSALPGVHVRKHFPCSDHAHYIYPIEY